MLKKLFNKFVNSINTTNTIDSAIGGEEIELSKIDKHMNFLLRDRLGNLNKEITEKTSKINHQKEETIILLRNFHKHKLMNTNIPEREIQIMEGNRENYIKKISKLITDIQLPKAYLEMHDYCINFSHEIEQLNRDIQKNIYVLQHFFSNEVKDINKSIHEVEEEIIEVRVLLEKNGILYLKDIQKDIKIFIDNALKIKSFNEQKEVEKSEIRSHQDKLDRLNERIKTITTGTDYRALEIFRQEKGAAENEIKNILTEINSKFSSIETALKKYYYLNPDKKLIREYLGEIRDAIINDKELEIINILQDVKIIVETDKIDLKDRKKEHCIETLEQITLEYLKNIQTNILKLEDQKQRAQTKITHNSASLNMSEQQYWINATEDKIKYHNTSIDRLDKNINTITLSNGEILIKIRTELEKLMDKKVTLKDDLTQAILTGEKRIRCNKLIK